MSELSLQKLKETASKYHEYMVPALFETWAEMVVSQTNIKPGDRVLDVACGAGVLARAAAKRTGNSGAVTGLNLQNGKTAWRSCGTSC